MTFLLTKYSSDVSETLYELSDFVIGSDFSKKNLEEVRSPYVVCISDVPKGIKGFVFRGQCSYMHFSGVQTCNIAVLKTVEHMSLQYSGTLEDVYATSYNKYSKFLNDFRAMQINVLITGINIDWIRDVCKDSNITLLEVIYN